LSDAALLVMPPTIRAAEAGTGMNAHKTSAMSAAVLMLMFVFIGLLGLLFYGFFLWHFQP
jgi:hypothetical protein